MRAYLFRSRDGEEETSRNSCVVERRCEILKGFSESEAFGASGGEEAASNAWRGRTESYETWRKFSLNQAETAVAAKSSSDRVVGGEYDGSDRHNYSSGLMPSLGAGRKVDEEVVILKEVDAHNVLADAGDVNDGLVDAGGRR
jgi:hypothetical protein